MCNIKRGFTREPYGRISLRTSGRTTPNYYGDIMTIQTVTPLRDRVLVAENKAEEKTASGIILDGVNSIRDSKTGTVLAIGPKVTDVVVGDKILLDWSKAQVVKVGDAQRVLIKQEDIVGVLEE